MDALQSYIASSKAPKKPSKVKQIVEYILLGLRKEYATPFLAERLNQHKVFTLMGKRWSYESLQMQILKMARFDHDSSLAWGLWQALKSGSATQADLELLQARVR